MLFSCFWLEDDSFKYFLVIFLIILYFGEFARWFSAQLAYLKAEYGHILFWTSQISHLYAFVGCSSAQIWHLWFNLHSLAKCPNFWYFWHWIAWCRYFSALTDVPPRKSLNLMAFSAISWSFSWTITDPCNLFTRFSFDESYWGVFISFIPRLKVSIFCPRRYRSSSVLNNLIGTV